MARFGLRAGHLALLSGPALWLLIGTTHAFAYGSPGADTKLTAGAVVPERPAVLVAQFHEPHIQPPPAAPTAAPPVIPPIQPPRVFAPVKLPPDSQAIQSGTPGASTSSKTSASSTAAGSGAKATTSSGRVATGADPAVKGLQELLAALGYDPGPADGLVGNRTWDAIFSWIAAIEDPDLQQEVRDAAHDSHFDLLLEYAGMANRNGEANATALAIYPERDQPSNGEVSGSSGYYVPINTVISGTTAGGGAAPAGNQTQPPQGRKAAVTSLQRLLATLGFDPGPADGIPGTRTNDALSQWMDSLEDPDLRQRAMADLESGDYVALAEWAGQAKQQSVASGDAEPAAQNGSADAGPTSPSGETTQIADTGDAEGVDATDGTISRGFTEQPDGHGAGDEPEDMAAIEPVAPFFAPASEASDPAGYAAESARFILRGAEIRTSDGRLLKGFNGTSSSADHLIYEVDWAVTLNVITKDFNSQIESMDYQIASADREIATLERYIAEDEKRMEQIWENHKAENLKSIAKLREAIAQANAELHAYDERLQRSKYNPSETKYLEQAIRTTNENIDRWMSSIADYEAENAGACNLVACTDIPHIIESREKYIEQAKEKKELFKTYKDDLISAYSSLDGINGLEGVVDIALADVLEDYYAEAEPVAPETAAPPETGPGAGEAAETEPMPVEAPPSDGAIAAADTLAPADALPEQVAVADPALDPEQAELLSKIDRAQSDIDYFTESAKQAQAELDSLAGRSDLSAEQKAAIRADIESRIKFNQVQLQDAQTRLAAYGGEYDGYQGKDFSDFAGLDLTQTDVELYRIAEKAKAQDQFYEELQRARDIIDMDAVDLDAITLNERVTDLAERVADNAESYNELAAMLRDYGDDIHVTRKQGELEYIQAMAEDAVLKAEEDLLHAQTVVTRAKNAEIILALGGMGYAMATGGLAATAVVGAQTQGVMAVLDGATAAIDGFDKDGFVAGLKEGGLQAGKYYLPVNTYLAVRDGHTDKTSLTLAIVGDAANLFSNVQTLKTAVNKAYAAQAKATQMGLSETDQAISRAAQAAQQNGDDLVRAYQNAKFEVELARRSGSGANVAAAQSKLETIVRAIDTSDDAKLAMKTRSTLVQAEFVDDQAQLIKQPAQEIWEQKMRDLGWSDTGIETQQIRNASSAGTVGLDDDIRLLEPSLLDKLDDGTPKYNGPTDPQFYADTKAFRERLTKNGQAQSLTAWERDAKQAMNEAYREVAGYTADEARVGMTTTVNDEAFKDIRLLDSGVNETSAGWAEQTASVTQEKMKHGIAYANELGLGDGPATASLNGVALQEATTEIRVATRELLKDLVGKAKKANPGYVVPAKIDKQMKILQKVADGTFDPAVANARLLKETGTSLAKTMETLGGHFEVIIKFK